MKTSHLRPQFVGLIPAALEEGVLYISTEYRTAVHLCACGCGNKSVTPISPAQWKLQWDGAEVSLWPSVGNWGFPCKSHYVIRGGQIQWHREWSAAEIAAGARRDREDRARALTPATTDGARAGLRRPGWLTRVRNALRRR